MKFLFSVLMLIVVGVSQPSRANLIVNGDFEAGNTGFGSDLPFTNFGCIGCYGIKARTLDWYNVPSLVPDFYDHTTGNSSGLMLQYDPAQPPANSRIWYQNVNVEAGATYIFSGWVNDANTESGPGTYSGIVGFYVGGNLIGQINAEDNLWKQFVGTYTASATGTIQLALRDLNPTTYNGTYTVIDDLFFDGLGDAELPAPGALALMGLGLLGVGVTRRRQ